MATTATTTGNGANKSAWDDKELGVLWRREKNGTKEKYLTGVLDAKKLAQLLAKSNEDIQVVCFTNKRKQKDTHPDLRIYLSEKKPAAKGSAAPAAPAATAPAATAPAPAPAPVDTNELI